MQTFLPFSDFAKSAKVLDRARLGKQRSECNQMLAALGRPMKNAYGLPCGFPKSVPNHPATLMWKGYENALALYAMIVAQEWGSRGYENNVDFALGLLGPPVTPPWLGDPSLHASHRSNLLRKKPDHYRRFGWSEPDNLPYIWPGTVNA